MLHPIKIDINQSPLDGYFHKRVLIFLFQYKSQFKERDLHITHGARTIIRYKRKTGKIKIDKTVAHVPTMSFWAGVASRALGNFDAANQGVDLDMYLGGIDFAVRNK